MRTLMIPALLACTLTAQNPDSCFGSSSVESPDIAYDPTNDVFLSTWSSDDALGCLAWTSGAIHNSSGAELRNLTVSSLLGGGAVWVSQWSPRVANVQSRGIFLVINGSDSYWATWLEITAIDAATGATKGTGVVGTNSAVSPNGSSIGGHDIGGDRSATRLS